MNSDFSLAVDPDAVDQTLEAYLGDPGGDPPEAVRGARLHLMIPLWKDWVGCIGLQRNGQLVFFTWDEPDKLEPVGAWGDHDRRMVFAARAQGSRRFPNLSGLAPVRGPTARVCPGCGGSGTLRDAPDNLVCQCGGIGWMPW